MTRNADTIQLTDIVGRSPLNVRAGTGDDDVGELAASIAALGLLQPLIVIERPDGRYDTVDGGRRHAALQLLVARGELSPTTLVDVLIGVGKLDGEVIEASLAANVVRRNLHPAEEYAGFAALAARGHDAAAIAKDFGVTERHVKQRLSIEKMAPRVRDLWRAGTIGTDVAQAFSYGDHDAQEKLLDDAVGADAKRPWLLVQPRSVTDVLTQATLGSDSPEAIFIGIDAYVAAGGVVDEDLFRDKVIFRDGALLKRLARERMMREAEALLDRYGYGFVAAYDEVDSPHLWGSIPPQFTPTERTRIQELDDAEAALWDDDATEVDDPRLLEMAEEREEIQALAMERAGTSVDCAKAGILVRLERHGDKCGHVFFDLGRIPPKTEKPEAAAGRVYRAGTTAESFAAEATKPATKPKGAPAAEAKPPGKALSQCLDEARTRAFVALVRPRPILAILLATAALSARLNRSPLRIETQRRNALVDHLPHVPFAGAAGMLVADVAAAPDMRGALLDRFAQTIAAALACEAQDGRGQFGPGGGAADPAEVAAFAELVAFGAPEDYAPQMARALDYAAYFKAVPKARILELVAGEIDGQRHDVKDLGKAELVDFATRLAKDRGWLPPELRPPTPPQPAGKGKKAKPPSPNLAEAMLQALQEAEDNVALQAEIDVNAEAVNDRLDAQAVAEKQAPRKARTKKAAAAKAVRGKKAA